MSTGRAVLISAAVFLAGLACVAVAAVAIMSSAPEQVDLVQADAPAPFDVSELTPVYRDDPSTAPQASPGDAQALGAGGQKAPSPPVGANLGTLSIPGIGRNLPIVEGTGDEELRQGVGHYRGSAMPGANNNCILSGHRDTALAGLGKLDRGAHLIVETSAGEFTYEVQQTRIVDKDDKTVIVPTDYPALTVTTCYPFSYIGAAPKRYVVVAALVRAN